MWAAGRRTTATRPPQRKRNRCPTGSTTNSGLARPQALRRSLSRELPLIYDIPAARSPVAAITPTAPMNGHRSDRPGRDSQCRGRFPKTIFGHRDRVLFRSDLRQRYETHHFEQGAAAPGRADGWVCRPRPPDANPKSLLDSKIGPNDSPVQRQSLPKLHRLRAVARRPRPRGDSPPVDHDLSPGHIAMRLGRDKLKWDPEGNRS